MFRLDRHLMAVKYYRTLRDRSFSEWAQVSCVENLS